MTALFAAAARFPWASTSKAAVTAHRAHPKGQRGMATWGRAGCRTTVRIVIRRANKKGEKAHGHRLTAAMHFIAAGELYKDSSSYS